MMQPDSERGSNSKGRLVKNAGGGLVCSFFLCALVVFSQVTAAQDKPHSGSAVFRVGEKLTYNIAFENFANAGYAELYVVSQGKLGDREAVELRSRVKTFDLMSAAFYAIDETRTTFVAADSGSPLFAKIAQGNGVAPKETVTNYMTAPSAGSDMLSLIYRLRSSGGAGNYLLQENERSYSVTAASVGQAKVRTDAGDFETSISSVQSEYLTEMGFRDLKINFSADELRIPVMARFKTSRGEFIVTLAGIQNAEEPEPAPAAVVPVIPRPVSTPRPIPTATPYIDNQPLSADLPFRIGEILEYSITAGGRNVGSLRLEAKERKRFNDQDSLLLAGTITRAEAGNGLFSLNDFIRVQVNPETLAPRQLEIRLSGPLSGLTQTTQFDEASGTVTSNGTGSIEAPVGTHSILSLLYAIRSFNLKPSKDLTNPVNDTRVAVYWDSKPHIFTLRPSIVDTLQFRGEAVPAQMITVNTGNPQLDMLGIKLWLGTNEKRLPLRISFGQYQVDLISESGAASK